MNEFWVVDANERTTFVHTGSGESGWTSVVRKEPDEQLVCAALPGFAFRLADA